MKIQDAYYSKDVYDRKREYAYRRSAEGLTLIAEYYAKQDGFTEDDDEFEEAVEAYEEIFEPIERLSHLRHEIHSTDRGRFVSGSDYDLLKEAGCESSDDYGVVGEVNALNEQYSLAPTDVPLIADNSIEVDMEIDSAEDILDYFGVTYDEDDDLNNLAYEELHWEWNRVIDDWSDSVREWFYYVNEKFGTDFPSRTPQGNE